MTSQTRRIGGVLVCLAAVCLGAECLGAGEPHDKANDKAEAKTPAAEKDADTKSKTGKADAVAEPYEEGDATAPLAGGCCGGPIMVPVCRCVPTMKKKQKTEYDVKCEMVCVPGCRSLVRGKTHGGCSDGMGCCDQPSCGHTTIRPKKTLLKKVVEEEEEAWEYKVEWVAAGCAAGCCSPDGYDCQPRTSATHARPWHALHGLWARMFHWE